MKNNRRSSSITLRIAGILFALVLITTYMSTGLYAKYVTSAKGSDVSYTAEFSISESTTLLTDMIAINIIPGQEDQTGIEVKNESEVRVRHTITIKNYNFPLSYELMKVVGDTKSSVKVAEKTLVYSAEMAPGEIATYNLVTTWEMNANEVVDSSLAGKVDILEISMVTEQID